MKTRIIPCSRPIGIVCMSLLLALGLVGPAVSQQSSIDFDVLDTSVVNLGNRSAIYNLVAPPDLPTPTPTPTPPPFVPDPSPKKEVIIRLSITVYDHEVADVRWQDENGFHEAFSNIDFNYLGVGEFETNETKYSLVFGLGNDTRNAALAYNVQLPSPSQFTGSTSQYFIVQDGSNQPTQESLKMLDDLHNYFDQNKQQLIDAYNKREADWLAQELWLKAHPVPPKDIEINFWPVSSTNYPTSQGGQQ